MRGSSIWASIHVTTLSTYSGADTLVVLPEELSVQRYSNPAGKPSPGFVNFAVASSETSDHNKLISFKKSRMLVAIHCCATVHAHEGGMSASEKRSAGGVLMVLFLRWRCCCCRCQEMEHHSPASLRSHNQHRPQHTSANPKQRVL